MDPNTVSLLADPLPNYHIIYPSIDQEHLDDAVTSFAAAGLSKGESVVFITTQAHSNAIDRRLELEGFDPGRLEADGQLTTVDSQLLLSKVSLDSVPNELLFKSIIGRIITAAKVKAPSLKVRLFGELVNVLWNTNLRAAVRIEEMWNDVIAIHSTPLLCTYSLDLHTISPFPQALLQPHSQLYQRKLSI